MNGQRKYTVDVLDQLPFIKTAQQAGFSSQEINIFPPHRWREMARSKCAELEDQQKTIEEMPEINGLKYTCKTWSECFTKANPTGTCG
ncbi:MerR family DNA-binding protein (plasmid) [Rossellomorea marisflavi]|nr:MerR family DNA-binding protein [Rossellomorea marisflavi]QHA38673.1 MerR family DNA-binding protein [Rossellomorea marisflavi]